jgi:peptidoglycan/xylan/chitin deacetylase (PgdA/CDA1 family)
MHTQQDNCFGILMYHRVAARSAGAAKPTWNVTPERFRQQLRGLLSRGYQAWPLRRALACRRSGEPVPARVFVVTFDDGYEGVYHNAWPILKELSVPATVFVVTSYLDTDRPLASDDWVAAGSTNVPAAAWRSLSTPHCAEMIEHGLVEVGSHTHTHADFRGRPEAFRSDLACSLDVLRDRLRVEQASFAFPFGYYDADMVAAVREAGMSCALTADQELVLPQADPFSWGRFCVDQSDTTSTLALKLNGWYTRLRRAWHWLRRPWEAGRVLSPQPHGHAQSTARHVSASKQLVSL